MKFTFNVSFTLSLTGEIIIGGYAVAEVTSSGDVLLRTLALNGSGSEKTSEFNVKWHLVGQNLVIQSDERVVETVNVYGN